MSLLDLPYELRLKIYHLVHLSSPVRPNLAPWSLIPQSRAHIVEAVMTEEQGASSDDGDDNDHTKPGLRFRWLSGQQNSRLRLLSPHRPFCTMPRSLLQTCHQVYTEARMIPFHENEFVFLDWFVSGLNSATVCISVLRPWQREALRYLRLEVNVNGLEVHPTGDSAGWVRLCGYLKGLEGLRLSAKMQGGSRGNACDMVQSFDTPELVPMGQGPCWIAEGLRKLERLRQLEVDLDYSNWTDRKKVEWCAKLQEMLLASHEAARVLVVCVKKCWNLGLGSVDQASRE
jgi:hypothetical protein